MAGYAINESIVISVSIGLGNQSNLYVLSVDWLENCNNDFRKVIPFARVIGMYAISYRTLYYPTSLSRF